MMAEWQPIETAPKDGTRVVLAAPGGAVQLHIPPTGPYLSRQHD